jgi:CRISPR-associated endonuclease/helicase Cas3
VLSPEVGADPEAGWYGEMFPKAQYVYANEAVVWLTAEKLGALDRVEIPDDLRDIIEYVYGGNRAERVPAGLEESFEEANRESRQHSALGDIEALNIESGYADGAGRWRQEPSTRIGRDSVTLRLVRQTADGELVPWADDARYPWRMSEIDVPAWRVGRVVYDEVGEGAVRELESEMPDGGRYAETVVLSDNGDGWRASVENERGTDRLAYDSERGLVFVD